MLVATAVVRMVCPSGVAVPQQVKHYRLSIAVLSNVLTHAKLPGLMDKEGTEMGLTL